MNNNNNDAIITPYFVTFFKFPMQQERHMHDEAFKRKSKLNPMKQPMGGCSSPGCNASISLHIVHIIPCGKRQATMSMTWGDMGADDYLMH